MPRIRPAVQDALPQTTATGGAEPAKHRDDIDGLRAFAVACVVLYHVNTGWLPGGFVGVDVFFVISGYVVTASLLRRRAKTPRNFVVEFYARRVKRLTPGLVVVVALVALLCNVLIPQDTPSLDAYYETALCALAGASNLYFLFGIKERKLLWRSPPHNATRRLGYFVDLPVPTDPSSNATASPLHAVGHDLARNPLLMTWSLGVEEQSEFREV